MSCASSRADLPEWSTAVHARPAVPAPVVTQLVMAFVGSGWLNDGDALLANTAAAQHRERSRVGREELAHEAWSGVAA